MTLRVKTLRMMKKKKMMRPLRGCQKEEMLQTKQVPLRDTKAFEESVVLSDAEKETNDAKMDMQLQKLENVGHSFQTDGDKNK